MQPQNESKSERRTFLGASGNAVGLLLLKPEIVFGSQANSAVEVGLIGAGGRGNWIGEFFVNQGGARITALADAFVDRLETAGAKFGVPESRRYRGIESYQQLLASKVDAVVVETP
ncbi:MAG TPA: gfo/Idh/MocA family oxidoreductase, partial [Bryobacteraceae bacterium]|nr:gfo/Idh/MocA family oxidoreductase [Bryobacteraceae bacterium]